MEKETERKMKQEREKWSGIDKFRDGQPASEPKLILEKMELYETKTARYSLYEYRDTSTDMECFDILRCSTSSRQILQMRGIEC